MSNDTRPEASKAHDTRDETQPAPRFIDPREGRRVPLGNLKTDAEAQLAAEIEKLRTD